jgi:predicted nucleotidyltransferase
MNSIALREKDLAVLRATLRRFPAVREARVFGSRATGTARRASDLDVSAPNATPREWSDLCDALENAPLIYEIDLVRPEQTTSAPLRQKIDREGIPIYPDTVPR